MLREWRIARAERRIERDVSLMVRLGASGRRLDAIRCRIAAIIRGAREE